MRKKSTKPNKINTIQKRKRIPPALIFVLTFSLVLAAGLTGILLLSIAKGGEGQTVSAGANGTERDHSFFWESIPEGGGNEKEQTASRYESLLADPAYMAANNIYALPNRKEGVVTLSFGGDILFDDEYAMMANLLQRGVTIENGISEALLARMQSADIMMLNNEFPYTNRGTPTEGKSYTFRADTDTVHYLHDMGVDLVSLANNHCFDFGETGLLDTLTTLEEAEIPYVGAGRNLEEAAAPVYFIVGDIKFAIVSATQIERLENPDTRGAAENTSGVFRCLNPEGLYEAVSMAKETSDFVIVYIHWGTENETEPDWAQLEQAPKLAEAGADLVIGDHPHCLQGIQYFGEVPVVYSVGNFWFNSKTLDTCLIEADFSLNGLEELRFIPAIQKDCRTDLAYGEEKQRIISYMERISKGVSIDSEGRVAKR